MINSGENERRLDGVFQAYRETCDYDSTDPHFMPMLWQRIEARRAASFRLERLARSFAGATAALALLAGVSVSLAPARPSDETWVENLAKNSFQTASFDETVRLSPVATSPAETRGR